LFGAAGGLLPFLIQIIRRGSSDIHLLWRSSLASIRTRVEASTSAKVAAEYDSEDSIEHA
jgi:hypothetical protein